MYGAMPLNNCSRQTDCGVASSGRGATTGSSVALAVPSPSRPDYWCPREQPDNCIRTNSVSTPMCPILSPCTTNETCSES